KDNEKLNENTDHLVYSVKKRLNEIKEKGDEEFNDYTTTKKNLELLNRKLKITQQSFDQRKFENEELRNRNDEALRKYENLKHAKYTYQLMLQRIKKEKKLLYFYLNSLKRTVKVLKSTEQYAKKSLQKKILENKKLKKAIEEKKMEIYEIKTKNNDILKYMHVDKEHSNILRIRREMINEYKIKRLKNADIQLLIYKKGKYKKLALYYILYGNYLKLKASAIFDNASNIYAAISKLREATGVTDIYDINQKFIDIENKKIILKKEEEISQLKLEDAIRAFVATNDEILNEFEAAQEEQATQATDEKPIKKKRITVDEMLELYRNVFNGERELSDLNIKLENIRYYMDKQNKYFYSINIEDRIEFNSHDDVLQYLKNFKGPLSIIMKLTRKNLLVLYKLQTNVLNSLEFFDILNMYKNLNFHKNMCKVDVGREIKKTVKIESKVLTKKKRT
ncbi:protein SOC3, putative, partial [Hepatocystis sp. ex Piliocolobus tephrosceles]